MNTDIVKELIKMMKTCCGKIIAYKLYCTIGTWFWIALQDPVKKQASLLINYFKLQYIYILLQVIIVIGIKLCKIF